MPDLHFQKYFLSLLVNRPVSAPDSWDGFAAFLIQEQLQGLAYRLTAGRNEVPDSIRLFLEQAYYATLAANTARIEYIKALAPVLASMNVPVILLKGAALLDTVYDDPGLRPMEDIDLLVRPDDFPALERVLQQSGYQPDKTFPKMFRRQDVLLDVHTSLLHTARIKSRQGLLPMTLPRIFEDSVPWKEHLPFVRVPADGAHLVYMSHHMIKHSFSKMIWVIDFFRMISEKDNGFWNDFESLAIEYHQEKPLAEIFFLLQAMLDFSPPEESIFFQISSSLSGFEKRLLDLKSSGHSIADWGNWLWAGCLKSRREKLMLLRETVFPAIDVQRREFPGQGDGHRMKMLRFRCGRIARRLRENLAVTAKIVSSR